MYQEFKYLRSQTVVDSIWYADSSDAGQHYAVPPEIGANLVIKLYPDQSEVVLSGAVTRQQFYPYVPDTRYFGVRLRPGYMCLLDGLASPHEIQNTSVSVPEYVLKDWGCLHEHLVDHHVVKEQLAILSQWIIERTQSAVDLPESMQEALHHIYSRQGVITVRDLCQITMSSERQLERLFRAYVGLSPKAVCNTVRVQHVLDVLWRSTEKPNLSGLALKMGYVDQSHLANDFRNSMGMSISKYIQSRFSSGQAEYLESVMDA